MGLQGIHQLEAMKTTEVYDVGSSPVCGKLKGLSRGQERLCQLHQDHMKIVARGAKEGIGECQHQFHDRRWNCSTVEDGTVFGHVLGIGKNSKIILDKF